MEHRNPDAKVQMEQSSSIFSPHKSSSRKKPKTLENLDGNFKPEGEWPRYLHVRGHFPEHNAIDPARQIVDYFRTSFSLADDDSSVHGRGLFQIPHHSDILANTKVPVPGWLWPSGWFLDKFGDNNTKRPDYAWWVNDQWCWWETLPYAPSTTSITATPRSVRSSLSR